jgi:hypothetical protein
MFLAAFSLNTLELTENFICIMFHWTLSTSMPSITFIVCALDIFLYQSPEAAQTGKKTVAHLSFFFPFLMSADLTSSEVFLQ